MNQQNKEWLDSHRWAVESYSQENIPMYLGIQEKERLLAIVREEFDSKHTADLWCDPCVKSLVLNAYQFYDNETR